MIRLLLFLFLFFGLSHLGFSQIADSIIQKYLYTIGEDFKTLNSFKKEVVYTVGNELKYSSTHYERKPKLSRTEHKEGNAEIQKISAYDGKEHWKQNVDQNAEIESDYVQSLFPDSVLVFGGTLVAPLLINAAENQAEITLLGTVVVDEQEYYELAHKRRGQQLYFYINTATYLLEIYSTGRLQEKILELNPEYTLLKDYRQVRNYLIFHKREYWVDGILTMEENIEYIIFNPELPDSLFEFPEKP